MSGSCHHAARRQSLPRSEAGQPQSTDDGHRSRNVAQDRAVAAGDMLYDL